MSTTVQKLEGDSASSIPFFDTEVRASERLGTKLEHAANKTSSLIRPAIKSTSNRKNFWQAPRHEAGTMLRFVRGRKIEDIADA
jgi:hypothetical protein